MPIEEKPIHRASEQKTFAGLEQPNIAPVADINKLMVQCFKQIEFRLSGMVAASVGIATGFHELDNLTGGLHESQLILLAGRSGVGKTALALNIAGHVAIETKIPTLYISLDLTGLEIITRMLSARGEVGIDKFSSDILSREDCERLADARAGMKRAPFFVDDTPNRTVADIAACARRLQQYYSLGLLIIDDLQLIFPDDPQNHRQKQLAQVVRDLRLLACELNIPVLCLVPLAKQKWSGKTNVHRELRYLRESGVTDRDADIVLFMHREKGYRFIGDWRDRKFQELTQLIVAKQSDGPVQEDFLLGWVNQYHRFEKRPAVILTDFTREDLSARKLFRIKYDDRRRLPWLLLVGGFLYASYPTHECAERVLCRLIRVLREFMGQ